MISDPSGRCELVTRAKPVQTVTSLLSRKFPNFTLRMPNNYEKTISIILFIRIFNKCSKKKRLT